MTKKANNFDINFKTQFRTTAHLSKEECEFILQKDNINSSQLEQLLEAREEGIINFNLIDVREWVEWVGYRIKFTNYLVPTTSFYEALKQIENEKDVPSIVYCHIGQRSAYCQNVMRELGFETVSNLLDGIAGFHGEIVRGK
mgnify:CR=1 FL=1